MHKTMASVSHLEKLRYLEVKSLCQAKQGQNFEKKERLFKGLKLPFWGLNYVEFWCWGLTFGCQVGSGPPGPPPGSAPVVPGAISSPTVVSIWIAYHLRKFL